MVSVSPIFNIAQKAKIKIAMSISRIIMYGFDFIFHFIVLRL